MDGGAVEAGDVAVAGAGEPRAAAGATKLPAGTGRVAFARVGARTAVVTRLAASPLKLLTPRSAADSIATVVTSTYGGGLVGGDRVTLDVRCGAGTRCAIGTQASTKVYRCGGDRVPAAGQELDVRVEDDAAIVVAPDPVTCFAAARYEQAQRFELAAGASLLAIEWMTSGRVARGERWAFESYAAETVIRVAGVIVARDAWRLDPADGPVGAAHRVGRFNCFASVYVLGPVFAKAAADVMARVGAMAAPAAADPVIASASPLGADGVLLRAAGGGAEPVGRWLSDLLCGAFAAFGADPWSRKW